MLVKRNLQTVCWRSRARYLGAAFLLGLVTVGGNSSPQHDGVAAEMLAAHNAVRARVGVPKLVWSDRLASVAQKWADTLIKRHQFAHQGNSSYGENLFEIQGAHATPEDVVHDWAAESLDYDYRSNRYSSVCGHYTQVVWRNTTEVGCASASGGRREVWVCEYSPPGNWTGHRPY